MSLEALRAPGVALTVAALLWSAPADARDSVRKIPNAPSPPAAAATVAPAAVEPAKVEPARASAAERASIAVVVDRAKVIRLPERTQTVVVGNPAIADLAVQKNGIVVVTGKSYGVTNLIALDASGALLAESTLSVSAATDAVVVVQRGLDRQSYSCTPNCQPSVLLGDANTYFSENRAQSESRNQFATSK